MRSVGVVAFLECAACATTLGCSSSPSSVASAPDAGADGEGDGATDIVEGGTDASCPAPDGATTTISPASNPPLVVAGDTGSVDGISDPSLSWPSGSAAGYLSYSTLQSTSIVTRIAKTTDGKSFTYLSDANAYVDLAVTTADTGVCGSSTCTGRLVHETPSLVDDPLDPDPTRRFKLFDYSYVIVPDAAPPPQHAWGYIGLYTATAPEKGWSAGSKAIGWTSTAPTVSSDGAATVLSTVPALQDCGAFTEPAALVDSATGDLYLALGCALESSARVVLLRSVDHASTFSYVGVLLDVADGTSLGSTLPGLMPTDFFQVGGVTYLIVSTFGSTPAVPDAPTGYTSCTTVHVDHLASASVQRDGQGNAVAVRKLVAPGGAFAGACAFKPQFATGYLVDEVTADGGTPTQVFASGLECP